MTDDSSFLEKLERRIYQIVIVHEQPKGEQFHWKKCGHEDLFISLMPENPLATRLILKHAPKISRRLLP